MKKTETTTTNYQFSRDELYDAIIVYLQQKGIRDVKHEAITIDAIVANDEASITGFTVTTTVTNGEK
jgi:hypothetical protein